MSVRGGVDLLHDGDGLRLAGRKLSDGRLGRTVGLPTRERARSLPRRIHAIDGRRAVDR